MIFRHWNDDQSIPREMPVLRRYLERGAAKQPLKGVTLLLIQHQLGNQVPQAEALVELGARPQDIYWLDIPYTATPEVRRHLVRRTGIPEGNMFANDYKVLDAYAPYQRRRTADVLRRFLKDPPEKLVVLDDGAYFVEAMSLFRKKLPHVAIVEQTTRGVIKLQQNAALRHTAAQCPLVNVAQSVPKLTLEPPFIGHAVCEALYRKLGDGFRPLPGQRCLVLGYGAIGKEVAASLVQHGYRRDRVHVYDTDKKKMAAIRREGYRLWARDPRVRFSLVVGCSGRSSFGIGDYVFLEHGAVLASASSGSVELSREDFIELADTHPADDIFIHRDGMDTSDIHSDLRFNLVDREVTFLNGGFPLNFEGNVNCVPAHYIQPTPTMMVEAAVMAAQAKRKGNFLLRDSFNRWLRKEFLNELGEEARVLA